MKKLLLITLLLASTTIATFAQAVEGDPTTFTVGDFENPELESPSQPNDYLPMSLAYNYTFSQSLYTPDMLLGLAVDNGSTKLTAKISSITFALDLAGYSIFDDCSFDITVYASTTDATDFPTDSEGKQCWMDITEAVSGTATISRETSEEWANALDCYFEGDNPKITVTFDTPIEYTGNTLVLSFLYSNIDVEVGSGVPENTVAYNGGKSAVVSSDSELGVQTGRIKGAGSILDYVPVIEIGYTPLTRQSSTQVTTIGDVAVSVSQVECSPKLSLSSEANVLEFAFDINDPANVGSYDVTLNSVNLGTVTGNFVQISFVNPNPAQDYVIGITPKADGVIGTTATVTKEQIASLFHSPAVEVTDWHLFSNYNATADKASVSASFLCTVSGIDGFAARYSNDDWCSSLGYGRVGLWGDQAYDNDIPDFLAALQPATATADNFNALKANGYKFAVAKMDLLEADVTEAELAPISERIYFKSTITQPVAYLATPTLGAAPASISGNSYKAYDFTTTVSVSATLTSADDHLQANVTFPEALEIKVDKSNSRIVVYAPEGSSLWYRIVEITDEAEDTPAPLLMAEGVWLEAPTNPWSIGKDDLAFDAIIELKIVTGGIESPVTSMVIKQSGEVASAATIEADNADAVRYFTPMGVEIAPEAITPGTLYIRRTATGATKHLAR